MAQECGIGTTGLQQLAWDFVHLSYRANREIMLLVESPPLVGYFDPEITSTISIRTEAPSAPARAADPARRRYGSRTCKAQCRWTGLATHSAAWWGMRSRRCGNYCCSRSRFES